MRSPVVVVTNRAGNESRQESLLPPRWSIGSLFSPLPYLVCCTIDCTEKKQAQQESKNKEERFVPEIPLLKNSVINQAQNYGQDE